MFQNLFYLCFGTMYNISLYVPGRKWSMALHFSSERCWHCWAMYYAAMRVVQLQYLHLVCRCRSGYCLVLHCYSMMFIISELLLHILSYIPIRTLMTVISQVCKRWYILASDPSLWRHLYVPAESSIDPHWLCYVASRCPLLKSLSIRGNVLNKFNTL